MATPHLPLDTVEDQFDEKVNRIFYNMRSRFKEKTNKRGRVIRIGRVVPFSKEQFAGWLLRKLGTPGGVVKCVYCADWLSLDNLVLDHRMPVALGGSLDLDNLDLVCKLDNDQKGGMCGHCYQALLDWSAGERRFVAVHPECRKDMLQRLSIAVQLAAQQRWEMAKRAKEKQKQTAAQATDGNNAVLTEEEPF